MINGQIGSRITIMNDGVRMQDMEWGEEHAPNISINSATNIAVIQGAAALAYGGDAVGGTILIQENYSKPIDSLYGKVSSSGFSNGQGYQVNASSTLNKKKFILHTYPIE